MFLIRRAATLTVLLLLFGRDTAHAQADSYSCPILTVDDPSVTGDALCMLMEVPLTYSDDDDRMLSLFLKKVPAADTSNPATARIFLIEGGPGQGGVGTENMVAAMQEAMPNLDVYIPDPRGVARSSPLNCTGFTELNDLAEYLGFSNETKIRECLESIPEIYGDDYLKHFDIANSAKDIMSLIKLTAPDGGEDQKVYVYSVSYGTQVIQRLLSIYPNSRDVIDGIIMDGIVATGYNYIMDNKDSNTNLAGLAGLDACAQLSKTCKKAFSDVPATFGIPLLRLTDYQNLCTPMQGLVDTGGGFNFFKEQMANLNTITAFRVFVPPLIYRLLRCSEQDVTDVETLLANLGAEVASSEASFAPADKGLSLNFILLANIVLSENYSLENKTVEDRIAQNDAYLFSGFSSVSGTRLHSLWEELGLLYDPTVTDGFGVYPDPSKTPPLLLVHGTLDPQTPFGLLQPWYSRHYKDSPHTFVRVPYGVHAMGDGQSECVMDIQMQFLKNPEDMENLEMSCLANIVEEIADYEGVMEQTKRFVSGAMAGGTEDLWPDDLTPLLPLGVEMPTSEPNSSLDCVVGAEVRSGNGLDSSASSFPDIALLLTTICSITAIMIMV